MMLMTCSQCKWRLGVQKNTHCSIYKHELDPNLALDFRQPFLHCRTYTHILAQYSLSCIIGFPKYEILHVLLLFC
jgi:hypothetical protein